MSELADRLRARAPYYTDWARDIRAMNGTSVDADHADATARDLLEAADELEAKEEELDDARIGPWPEWAEKLLRFLEADGWKYDADDEISLPDELAEWLAHYASAMREDAKRKSLSRTHEDERSDG